MKKHIITSVTVIIIAAFCAYAQSDNRASEHVKVENPKPATTQPAEGQKVDSGTGEQPKAEEIDVAKIRAKAMYEAKADYNKKLQKLIREKSSAEAKLNANQKELDKATEQQNAAYGDKIKRARYAKIITACTAKEPTLQQAFDAARKNLEEHKKLVPGKTYFKRIDKANLSKGKSGQLITGKYQIIQRLGTEAMLIKIAVDEKIVQKSSGYQKYTYKTYTYQTVRLEMPVGDKKAGPYYNDDGIFYVKEIQDGSTPVLIRICDAPAAG